MKKHKITIAILILIILTMSVYLINIKNQRDWLQKNIDSTFTASYREVTLNLLNMTLNEDNENAIHMYNTKNTKHSNNLGFLYQFTSFSKNGNADLNYVIAILAQSTGYGAVTEIEMNEELYDNIKNVPDDYFNNEEIIHKAKIALENALVD